MGYTKLFYDIILSTVWREKDPTRLVWITMLAMRNKHHIVEASLPGLADCARVSLEDCQEALRVLSSPDPWSRTKELEGRRIQEVDGGWWIVNGEQFRRRMSEEERREKNAIYQRNHRERKKSVSTDLTNKQSQHSTETETETETEQGGTLSLKGKPRDLNEVIQYAQTKGISADDAEGFFDSQTAGGWRRGGKAMKDWKASLRTWKRYGWLPSHKRGQAPEPKYKDITFDV